MKNSKFFTIPNILTLIRISLIPFLVILFFNYYTEKPYISAIIYIAAAGTDLLDGIIARRYNMMSDAGKVLDPLADKLFLNIMLLCFVIKGAGIIITSLLIINVIKEIYMVVAGMLLYKRKYIMSSKFIGKAAAFVFNVGIIIYFFIPYAAVLKTVSEIILLTGLALSLTAGIYYTVIVYRQTGGHLPPKNKL